MKCVHGCTVFPTRFSLAVILVLAGTAGAGGMAPPTSTGISDRMKRVQEYSSPANVRHGIYDNSQTKKLFCASAKLSVPPPNSQTSSFYTHCAVVAYTTRKEFLVLQLLPPTLKKGEAYAWQLGGGGGGGGDGKSKGIEGGGQRVPAPASSGSSAPHASSPSPHPRASLLECASSPEHPSRVHV